MKWYVVMMFLGGEAELVPVGSEPTCHAAVQSMTSKPMPAPWKLVSGKRTFVAASCLPCPIMKGIFIEQIPVSCKQIRVPGVSKKDGVLNGVGQSIK